jgi:acetylornithine deacetylase
MNNEVQSILATLLAFDTTSRESNLEMIDYINRFLRGFGIASRLFYDDDGKKANLYARLGPPGAGA